MATTVAFTDLENKFIGLGIACGVTAILAGAILQYTRRIKGIPSYLRSNFSLLKGTFHYKLRQYYFNNHCDYSLLLVSNHPTNITFSLGHPTWSQSWSKSNRSGSIYCSFYLCTLPSNRQKYFLLQSSSIISSFFNSTDIGHDSWVGSNVSFYFI